MQKKPSLYIGKQPWYIGRFWVDMKTKEVREDTDTEEDRKRREEKTEKLARNFNYRPKEEREPRKTAI